jgi:hypothetical protein
MSTTGAAWNRSRRYSFKACRCKKALNRRAAERRI